MLLWNVIGMGCIIAWNAVTSILLFGTLHKVGVLRVKKHVEIMGLDAGKHDERAYPECKIIFDIFSCMMNTSFLFSSYRTGKECRELQEEQVASFFQAYFGPICRLVISPEIVVIRVKSQSLFMALGQKEEQPSIKYHIQW